MIRLPGQGTKKINSYGHGDHYVHLKIAVPKRLDEKQKALLMAYAELETETPGAIHNVSYKKDGNYELFRTYLYHQILLKIPSFEDF